MNLLNLPSCRTGIVATIGPASDKVETLVAMISAGMNIARLNFSHGDPAGHSATIANIRKAAKQARRRVAIMADLPGPKMRLGPIADGIVTLRSGQRFTLTTRKVIGNQDCAAMSYNQLPSVVRPGNILFLNDGFIQLQVEVVDETDVHCRVLVGGEISSHKGLNLPGIDLGASAFTDQDQHWLAFACQNRLDAVSQSFVAAAGDLEDLRKAAAGMDYNPFVIAKIERLSALDHIDEILAISDGIMIARGDLGVEIPIETIAVVQKQLMVSANLQGKPVITATQMLESMIHNRRPTRAEATDVANAILDGTDCVMLSGESAMGAYPVESVAMLSSIATVTENSRSTCTMKEKIREQWQQISGPTDLIALTVNTALEAATPAMLLVPTQSGDTARNIARFRHPVWILAISNSPTTCSQLCFSRGVYPVLVDPMPPNWNTFAATIARQLHLQGVFAILVEGPSPLHPANNHRLELIDLEREANAGKIQT